MAVRRPAWARVIRRVRRQPPRLCLFLEIEEPYVRPEPVGIHVALAQDICNITTVRRSLRVTQPFEMQEILNCERLPRALHGGWARRGGGAWGRSGSKGCDTCQCGYRDGHREKRPVSRGSCLNRHGQLRAKRISHYSPSAAPALKGCSMHPGETCRPTTRPGRTADGVTANRYANR
jgi:hypothetical protein